MPEGKAAFREVLPKQGTGGGRAPAARPGPAPALTHRASLPSQGSCRWRTRPPWCCASPRCCPSSRCRWRSWRSCSGRRWRRRGRPRGHRRPGPSPRPGEGRRAPRPAAAAPATRRYPRCQGAGGSKAGRPRRQEGRRERGGGRRLLRAGPTRRFPMRLWAGRVRRAAGARWALLEAQPQWDEGRRRVTQPRRPGRVTAPQARWGAAAP